MKWINEYPSEPGEYIYCLMMQCDCCVDCVGHVEISNSEPNERRLLFSYEKKGIIFYICGVLDSRLQYILEHDVFYWSPFEIPVVKRL